MNSKIDTITSHQTGGIDMENVYVYLVKLPPHVNEMVVPCINGYTVYIDETLDDAHRIAAYDHALKHIKNSDFDKSDVQQIEANAHERRKING